MLDELPSRLSDRVEHLVPRHAELLHRMQKLFPFLSFEFSIACVLGKRRPNECLAFLLKECRHHRWNAASAASSNLVKMPGLFVADLVVGKSSSQDLPENGGSRLLIEVGRSAGGKPKQPCRPGKKFYLSV